MGHMHRGLGDAIHIDQLGSLVAMTVEPRLERSHFEGFPTKDLTERRARLAGPAFPPR